EQLLVLARLDEVGRNTVDEDVQLDVLLRELAETYGRKMERAGGRVILEEPPDTTIQGDLDELIRLFSNILDNAAKYGPGDGTIRISLARESDGYATVCIHDEGGKIPPEILPHLFDRFYRADPSRSKSTGGAGLGLAIAREIARRHNGDISITSNRNSGTLVCIRLAISQ
ncbi:MAG: HAMP domain-containing sensor histidine kinase, partial [Planctomycetota bacterium]